LYIIIKSSLNITIIIIIIIYKKFNRYVEIRDNNIVINKIKDDIKLLLYNNRNIVNTQKITDNTKPVEEILLT
jgi:hypothetical protein